MPHEDAEGGGGGVGGGGGGGGWWSRWWRALVGEALGTALLVALGVGSMLPAGGGEFTLTHAALAFGGVVTALVAALGPVSGAHMNPAVTLAALLHRQIPPAPAAAYVLAQIAGAVCGFGALMSLEAPMPACHGATLPAAGLGAGHVLLVEALLTGTLALVAGALWAQHDPAHPDHSAPIKLGLTVAGLVYAGGKLTGASLNPARSVAPALLLGCWRAHWAYWAGPLGGAALASLLQLYVLTPRPHRRPLVHPRPRSPHAAGEDLPLSDKPDH